ncbi:MAG: response regulator [Candidatus Methanoperedenaceae archaeon]|nr:response regulator [Candidatus Methanoperedenaceae archaeon]
MTYEDRILVVDDESDICWAIGNILKREGYHITLFVKGKDALRLAKDMDFKIAFIVVKFLDMNWIKLCQMIKEASPETLVVVVSGYLYPDDDVVLQGLEEGIFEKFISKPFNLAQICQVVKNEL